MAIAVGAAAEEQKRSCRALLEELWRKCTPEAGAEQAKHAHIHTLVNPLGGLEPPSESGPEQDSDVHEDPERINE